MDQNEGGSILKQLYLKKFYTGNRPRNTLEKVISFQQKIQDFKISKNSFSKDVALGANNLLEQESNRFRPTTNHSNHHYRREKHSFSHDNKRTQGPALSELRLILQKRDQGDHDLFQQGRTQKTIYTAQGYRNRMKLLSHREISRQENSDHQEKISKINMSNFLQDRSLSSSQKKARPLLYTKKQNVGVKENHNQIDQAHKIVSKKVFIGGRDLEKAAEEYFKHYKQVNKKIQTAQAVKREKMSMPISERRIIERTKANHRAYKKQKVIIPNRSMKNGLSSRTQPKIPKYDDMIINLDLDPWNVDNDYF